MFLWLRGLARCTCSGSCASTRTVSTSVGCCGDPSVKAARCGNETLGQPVGTAPRRDRGDPSSLAGKALVAAGADGFEIERSLPHGHVAAVWAMAADSASPSCWARRPERDPSPHWSLRGSVDRRRSWPPPGGGPTPPWPPTWVCRRCDRRRVRGDGLAGRTSGRHRSDPRPPAPASRRAGAISTCRARGWRADAARSLRGVTPVTTRRARTRSSTGC